MKMGFFKGLFQGMGITVGMATGFYLLSHVDFLNISMAVKTLTESIGEFFINLSNSR